MQHVKTALSKASKPLYYEILRRKIDGFTTLPSELQSILESFVAYKLSVSEPQKWNGLKVDAGFFEADLNHAIPAISFLKPGTKAVHTVNGYLPLSCTRYQEVVEHVARGFAEQGCPVVSASTSSSGKVTFPIFFTYTLSVDIPSSLALKSPTYHAYVVDTGTDPLLQHDFYSRIHACGEEVQARLLRSFDDYAGLVDVANRNGYRVEVNLDMYSTAFTQGSTLLITSGPAQLVAQLADGLRYVEVAQISDHPDSHVFTCNGSKLQVSPLLFDSVLQESADIVTNEEATLVAANDFGASPKHGISSIQELLNEQRLVSFVHLSSFFDSCINTYKVNMAHTPYFSYVSFSGHGRYIVATDTYVWSDTSCVPFECASRILFEHHLYNGTPVEIVLKVVQQEGISDEAEAALCSIIKAFDILGGELRVERSVHPSILTDFMLSVCVVSEVKFNIAKILGSGVTKGDLIYHIDLNRGAYSRGSGSNPTSMFKTEDLAGRMLDLKVVKALIPVTKGGLFYTLFSVCSGCNLGFDITTDAESSVSEFLFSEQLGRIVVVVEDGNQDVVIESMSMLGASMTLVGHFTKGEIRIDDESQGFIADLKKNVSFAFQNNTMKMAAKKVVKPYGEASGSKKQQVASMFDNIAHKYDFLNHFLSLGIDKLWRRRLVKEVGKYGPQRILDIATGTGDLAIALSKLKPTSIVGLDISVKMIEIGRVKLQEKGLSDSVFLMEGDSENIAFDSSSFDFATVAFGVRNFENPQQGLNEIFRVLKPGGGIAVLEFAMPEKFPFRQLYKFYFFRILPAIGRLFSKDTSAYTYLPESVEAFPSGTKFTELLGNSGFKNTRIIPLTFGVANIYIGEK